MTPMTLLVAVAGLVLASDDAGAGATNMELHYGVCVHCHGAHGEGRPELGTPRLGDLDAATVERQLRAFRDGTRGADPDDRSAHPMVAIARGLPDDTVVTDLAAFVEGLSPELRDAGPASAVGARLYGTCGSCHGADARGNATVGAPDLLYQDSAYLARQLRGYRDGWRGGAGAHPLAQAMAGAAKGLSDADTEALATHIASLRPERPAVENYPVTVTEAEGLAAFADIYAVSTHPRCLNCHPDGDGPLVGDDSQPHGFGITRFSPLEGTHCSACHAAVAVDDGLAPLPPADPIWSMAPAQMVFEGRSPAELCGQLKDPAINGGRGSVASTEHIAHDHLLMTSWHSGRTPPPIPHAELVKRFETWGRAGSPCPTE